MQGARAPLTSQCPTPADCVPPVHLEMRLKRMEDAQTGFDRMLAWVEQAVLPGRLRGKETIEARFDRIEQLVHTTQKAQQDQINKLIVERGCQATVVSATHQSLKQMSQEFSEYRRTQGEVVDKLEARQDILEDI